MVVIWDVKNRSLSLLPCEDTETPSLECMLLGLGIPVSRTMKIIVHCSEIPQLVGICLNSTDRLRKPTA